MSSRRGPTPAIERFPYFVDIIDTDGCIEWTGSKTNAGYGVIGENGKPRMATHVSLELAGYPRPGANLFALHKCDNPACVNPKHLWWGTQSENMRDQISKGRNPRVLKTHCPKGHPYDASNTLYLKDGRRQCRTCNTASKLNKRAGGPGKGRWGIREICKHGHALTPDNVYTRSDGNGRQCKNCAKLSAKNQQKLVRTDRLSENE